MQWMAGAFPGGISPKNIAGYFEEHDACLLAEEGGFPAALAKFRWSPRVIRRGSRGGEAVHGRG